MQFCWLQPDQRPNAEEVHLLLSYLCAKGASEAEEDFERRWNSLRPNTGFASAMPRDHASSSSFPLLEQFSAGDGYHSECGDDVLTVTETSHGLNFEYKWEQARADPSYRGPDSSRLVGQAKHHCQEAFYPPGGIVGGCPMESISRGVSPPYYQSKHLHAPGVLPVLSAHSPSVGSEYYIRIEGPVDCNMDPDYTMCSYSPDYQGSSGSFLTGSADSGECMAKATGPYWSADVHKADAYDSSDSSPAISLTMEPLLGQVSDSSPLRPWESSHYVSYKDRDGGYYYEHSPPLGIGHSLIGGEHVSEHHQESWGSRSLRQALGELGDPLGTSPSVHSPRRQAYRDAYLDTSQTVVGRNITGGYYDMMGSLRKTMPSHNRHNSHSISINMETEGVRFIGHRDSESEDEEEDDIFAERHTCNTWPSKQRHSSAAHYRRASHSCRRDTYIDFHYTLPSTDIEDSWPEQHSLAFHSLPKPISYLEPHQAKDNSACLSLGKLQPVVPPDNCNAYIYLCHEGETQVPAPGDCCHSHFVDPLTGLLVRNNSYGHSYSHGCVRDKLTDTGHEEMMDLSPAPGGPIVAKPSGEPYVDLPAPERPAKDTGQEAVKDKLMEPRAEEVVLTNIAPPPADNMHVMVALAEPPSEPSQAADSGVDQGGSSVSLADILDCSDDEEDDITDDTSGIFADESSEVNASPAFKSLQKQEGTPDSTDSMDLASAAGSCEGFSSAAQPASSPKAMDSGYDTENNESPEFVPKEPHEPREPTVGKSKADASQEEDGVTEEPGVEAETNASQDEDVASDAEPVLQPLSDKTPYRDSAYFSDNENERQCRHGEELPEPDEDDTEDKKGEKRKNQECDDKQTAAEGVDVPSSSEADSVGGVAEEDASVAEGLDEWPSREESSSLGDWAAEVVGAMEEALGALHGACSFVLDHVPRDEVALQHTAARRFSSSPPPPSVPAPTEGQGSAADAEDADKEDGDSDDSDESDEEPRLHPGPEPSGGEESEDESLPVPIVVSDDSEAHKLRSVLKTSESPEDGPERGTKTVTFFDDVTVYLFDQVSDGEASGWLYSSIPASRFILPPPGKSH